MSTPAISWKRNLAFAWVSQVLSIMGFSFALPFIAFYIQKDLGVTDEAEAKYWTSMCMGAVFLSLAVAAPLWGILADRYGRKLMMLRANLAAAVIVALMGVVPNVEMLCVLRLIQGMFTGTMTAAQALVASYTPQNRQGIALGSMSAAVFGGHALGSWCGAEFADTFGYSATFYMGGGILLLAFFLVLFGIREEFERPKPIELSEGKRRLRLPSLGYGGPILLLIAAVPLARRFDGPMLPFLLQDIFRLQGSGDFQKLASLWAGRTMAFVGLGAFVGGFVWGRISDRVAPRRMAKACAFAAALCLIPQMLAWSIMPVVGGRMAMAFFGGGLDPVFQIWLARVTAPDRRARIFGWAVTAKAIGTGIAVTASGSVGVMWGARHAFFCALMLHILLIPLVSFVAVRVTSSYEDDLVDDVSDDDDGLEVAVAD
jgi:MFS transporter, DHA1 family, multidrug resistance protein